MLNKYLNRIYEITRRGDAREESYYSTLETLLLDYSEKTGQKRNQVTTLPKPTEAGNPDFRVWDGRGEIVGYIEAKKIGQNLDEIQGGEQLKRYLGIFPNVILTNFTEFRLYRGGELIDRAEIARPYIFSELEMKPPLEKESEFFALLEKFFAFSLPKTYTAKALAVELAKRTRFLKEQVLIEELKQEETMGGGSLTEFYEAFKTFLIAGLTREDFADLYAQTIAYGLFAARTRAVNGFNRKSAFDNIPHTIGILRDIFRFVSLGDLPDQMGIIIDDISEVLAVADVNKILHKYFHEGKGRDPIVHFYETFLAEYDPATRERRGVYYTPEPVVSYIVRSINRILKDEFGLRDGLAETDVRLLDPAAGTLTFLAETAKLVIEESEKNFGEGIVQPLIQEHILENFYAFELMMAPYAIGHLKMAFLLEELGYRLSDEERIKLYLTNTLEMEELEMSRLPGMASLAEESHLAGEVKRETPILVILGNPPYSGHSTNVGKWISEVIRDYYRVDGQPLGEKNPKWLQDDYVKFIRFAQWKIDQAGEGVLGFITNHGYLDNPTFRGMRQSLLNSFDEIYLLDLHGNSLKKEKAPDGGPDENVFDIRQGVAIALFIKKKPEPDYEPGGSLFEWREAKAFEKAKNEPPPFVPAKVRHAEIWGSREEKYRWLIAHDIKNTKWKTIKPKSELYLFVPRDEGLLAGYERFRKVTEIFPVNGVGMTTARDAFVIDFDKQQLLNRIRSFKNSQFNDEQLHTAFGINIKKGWSIRKAWESLQEIPDNELEEYAQPVLYRPFDVRDVFYNDPLIERSRREVMRHLFRENLGVSLARRPEIGHFEHVFCTENPITHHSVSLKEVNYLFPLYLYEDENPKPKPSTAAATTTMLFEDKAKYGIKKPNIAPEIFEKLAAAFGRQPSPEEIFHYIYGILYSPTYRTKYAEFLKTDFPRVPFSADKKTFNNVGSLGRKLIDLHLVKSAELDIIDITLKGKGDNLVEKPLFEAGKSRVFINNDRFFTEIDEDQWSYRIGGYQILQKWLKDRKGRHLSIEDIKHYCRVATAIKKTIEIQKELDNLYEEAEKKTIDF